MGKAKNADRVNVQIEGDISGQVAIGNNILQIGDVYGGVVNIVQPGKKPTFTQRALPVFVRPRPFHGFLNREQEMGTAADALHTGLSISVYGEMGFGKTTLLRQLAYQAPADNFPHGVVYFSVRNQMVEDLLQIIFDYFYKSDSTVKPTDAELRRSLQDIQALILLDHLQLSYDDVTELVNAVPQCVFILASPERSLWGEGRFIELHGLPTEEALTLITRELGRALTPEERTSAETLCQLSDGQPLFLLQASALVRDGKPFDEIVATFKVSEDKLSTAIFEKLTESQQALLGVLATLKNIPIPTKHLASLTGADDIDTQLKTLLDLRLLQAHSPAYSLTGSLALPVSQLAGATDWENRILNYFVDWVRQNPPLPDVTDVLDLILSLLERANQDGRWDDVIALGRGIEKVLVLNKRWQAWRQVLEWMLKAAQSLNDQAIQAWALHQLGTRSLCLGDLPTAQQSLTQALGIRESLGDKAGAAVTRHNLGLIAVPPAPPRDTPRSRPKPASGKGKPPMLKGMFALMGFAVVAIALILIWVFVINPPSPSPIIPPTSRTVTRAPVQPADPTEKPVTQSCGAGVWYCEDFQDNQAQDWGFDPGWSIQKDGSNYILTGNRHSFAYLQDHSWSDYRVTFRLRLNSGVVHLNYRLSTGDENIIRYFVGFSAQNITLTRQVNDNFIELTGADARHSLGQWHLVEIAGWGGHIAVFVDGRLELQYVDEEYLRSGSIAFEPLDNSSVDVDDIEVMAPGDEPEFNQRPVSCYMTTEEGFDRPGMDIESIFLGSDGPPLWEECANECYAMPECQAYTAVNGTATCWLKNGQPDLVTFPDAVSGIKICE